MRACVQRRYYRHATAVAAGVSSLSCVDTPLAGGVGVGGARAALYARFGRPVTLQQCLAGHTSPETLDGDNVRYCSACKVWILIWNPASCRWPLIPDNHG